MSTPITERTYTTAEVAEVKRAAEGAATEYAVDRIDAYFDSSNNEKWLDIKTELMADATGALDRAIAAARDAERERLSQRVALSGIAQDDAEIKARVLEHKLDAARELAELVREQHATGDSISCFETEFSDCGTPMCVKAREIVEWK